MTKVAITAGVALSVLLTHGIFYGGKDLGTDHPVWTYAGLSQHALLAVNTFWFHFHHLPSEADCRSALEQGNRQARPARVLAVEYRQNPDSPAGVVCDASHRHIGEFLRFLMPAVRLACPTLGFLLFLLLDRRRPGLQLCGPLTMVVVAVALPYWGFWAEMVRAGLVALGMMGSVALFADTKRRENAI